MPCNFCSTPRKPGLFSGNAPVRLRTIAPAPIPASGLSFHTKAALLSRLLGTLGQGTNFTLLKSAFDGCCGDPPTLVKHCLKEELQSSLFDVSPFRV